MPRKKIKQDPLHILQHNLVKDFNDRKFEGEKYYDDFYDTYRVSGVVMPGFIEYVVDPRIKLTEETVYKIFSFEESGESGDVTVVLYGELKNGDFFHMKLSCDFTRGYGVLTISPTWKQLG